VSATTPYQGYAGAGYQPQPGYGYPPPYGPAGASAAQPGGDGQPPRSRFARGGVLVAIGLVIALFSGAIGGLAAHQYDKSQPTVTITRKAAPVIQPGSVASVAAEVQPAVVDITTAEGEGSGVVISADGAILTNNHVVAGAENNSVKVTFNDGKSVNATIVGTDPAGDLAVVKAQGVSGLTVAKWGNSDDMQVGDTVLALGSPLGLQGSVTAGIISATGRTIDESSDGGGNGQGGIPGFGQQGTQRSIGDALQTDAAINPGNSGGALVNLAGEVVGINTAIATSGQGSSGNIGVGFAISSNVAKSTAQTLLSGGKVSHPYIGVSVADGNGGALISSVTQGSPADKAGLQRGDLVTKVGGKVIKGSSDLVGAVHAGKVGQQLTLSVTRNGVQQNITVTLGQQP
jgi:putative serine protease PepD